MNSDSSEKFHPSFNMRLPRSLSSLETWGFGMSGLLLWLGTGPGMHAALGSQAIFVWLPSAIVGMLLNLQVKHLGTQWSEMSGGTANYTTRLLKRFPGLGRLAAIGYFLGWSSVPAMNAIILTDLIKTDLAQLGINCPEMWLKLSFTLLPFILAFSGTRALGILHLSFVLPALGLLLIFCLQGLGWLTFSPASPGLIPPTWSNFSFPDWAKWYFIAVYAIYDCETCSSFVAESKQPTTTLQCLPVAAWLIPPIYLGGSWLLMQLATQPGMGDNTFLNLSAVALPFWGRSASWLVTLLIVCSCLLSSATAVSNCPRILYQLSLDGLLSPVFAVVSRRGVLGPALSFNLFIGLIYLLSGDLARIVMITGTGYLSFSILFHLALWLRRDKPEVKWPWLSLGFFLVEVVVLVVGGLAWSWQDLLIGLLLMPGVLMIDAAIRRIPFPPFHAAWWRKRYQSQRKGKAPDFMMVQVVVLICLICGTTAAGWLTRYHLDALKGTPISTDLLAVLLVTIAFIGVAIACWTSLPQVAALDEAREEAEHLLDIAFDTVPDAILVLDDKGVIRQVNPAAQALFMRTAKELVGYGLNELLSQLGNEPNDWPSRSEHHLLDAEQRVRIIETTIAEKSHRHLQQHLAILRDITERKQAEELVRSEREKAERLLLNILPEPIAIRLKDKESNIAESFAEVTVLFADIVDFTKLSVRISPTELVSLLNQIFSLFDHLAEEHGLEKIKTIGDAYMVVGGLPIHRTDHAEAIAQMALDMQKAIAQFNTESGEQINMRIGINTGPVVAGVIGIKKFIYDLWGDTVNTASRMESHGIKGEIQVTAATYEILREQYLLEERGIIHIKGKGDMMTYLLKGRKEALVNENP